MCFAFCLQHLCLIWNLQRNCLTSFLNPKEKKIPLPSNGYKISFLLFHFVRDFCVANSNNMVCLKHCRIISVKPSQTKKVTFIHIWGSALKYSPFYLWVSHFQRPCIINFVELTSPCKTSLISNCTENVYRPSNVIHIGHL